MSHTSWKSSQTLARYSRYCLTRVKSRNSAARRFNRFLVGRGVLLYDELPKIEHPFGHGVSVADGSFAYPFNRRARDKRFIRRSNHLVVENARMDNAPRCRCSGQFGRYPKQAVESTPAICLFITAEAMALPQYSLADNDFLSRYQVDFCNKKNIRRDDCRP